MPVAVDATAPVGFITLHQHGPAACKTTLSPFC
jgi:hypothetical protein